MANGTAHLGSDFSGATDLDPAMREASPERALLEAIVRRHITPRGAYLDWPDYGFDLTEVIGSAITDKQIRQRSEEQCFLEEGVLDCEIKVTRTNPTGESGIELSIDIKSALGPLSLTLNVSAVDVTAIIPQEL